jgi:hypothetical protein
MAAGVQQVWTMACYDTGAACAGAAAVQSATAVRRRLSSRGTIAPSER